MQTCFLLGPSGSGKSYQCLTEVRSALHDSPSDLPLVFLAPKQSTFQIERQLLAGLDFPGCTRLRILSFERLAETILKEFRREPPRLLNEEGRLMVLRALLSRKRNELKLFRATARLPGFAQQLSLLLREFQRSQVSPTILREAAERMDNSTPLKSKLRDLALIMEAYSDWLREQRLSDEDQLLCLAVEALSAGADSGVQPTERFVGFGGMWLDGFAELTRVEIELLALLLPFCRRATLAFNLDPESEGATSWLFHGSVVRRTFNELEQRLCKVHGINRFIHWLDRESRWNRFSQSPTLRHLERNWSTSKPVARERPGVEILKGSAEILTEPLRRPSLDEPIASSPPKPQKRVEIDGLREALQVFECQNPEAEVILAARGIRDFARGGGRYNEAAVIVRNLESYHESVKRVFGAYSIPFFLDRREPIRHHPLPELTRSALRIVGLQWQTEDWFAALKTGFIEADPIAIDRLENEAFARGWNGKDWLQPLKLEEAPELSNWLEALRLALVEPFVRLEKRLGPKPSGVTLAAAIIEFWNGLNVPERLQNWAAHVPPGESIETAMMHQTVWTQMQAWVDNLALAFARESLDLLEWLPIVESGLGSLTIGVIPPSLDQVMVGAIDRSRNPEIKQAYVLGLNESIFPATVTEPNLLTEPERNHLSRLGAAVGDSFRHCVAREQYYGYIACTRARESLILTYALRDANDKALNPSPFLDRLVNIFPDLQIESQAREDSWENAEHLAELTGRVERLADQFDFASIPISILNRVPTLSKVKEHCDELRKAADSVRLSPILAEALYGPTLQTSVSRLEEYAACPFKFFVTSGMRAEERKTFELDARQLGSFQHEILARFHQELLQEERKWRDITPDNARERIQRIIETVLPHYDGGLFQADEERRFTARSLGLSLQLCVQTLIGWMPQYRFDPHAVELPFGIEERPLPAWEVHLSEGRRLSFRGKIDRVDLWRVPGKDAAFCVVVDYKSSAKQLDPVLMAHGIQMQLPAYLNVLRSLSDPKKVFGVQRLIPVGVFFVNLRGRYGSTTLRREVLDDFEAIRAAAYQHTGRFDVQALPQLDSRKEARSGDQFNYRLRNDGNVYSNCREALDKENFSKMLLAVEQHLIRMGNEIFAGVVRPDPFKKGNQKACDHCDFQSICRIDPWTHSFRVLRESPAPR